MIGKVPPEVLSEFVFGRTGAADDRVIQGPAYGEDTAAVEVGDDVLVVNTDPISLAAERVGTLGVEVACNDVAASGGDPAWLSNAIFLPDDDPEVLDAVTAQMDEAAIRRDVAIVGGHSEYAPTMERPMLVLTCLGLADRYVPSGGADPGDRILLTKAAGVEGTAILASDFRDDLADEVSAEVFDRAESFYEEIGVTGEARVVRDRATAMHDPTEGGMVDGLLEMATASGTCFSVDPDAIPVREETRLLCAAAGVDPLRIFGSGALLATVPGADAEAVLADLHAAGHEATAIGEVRASDDPRLELGAETFRDPVRDDMYDLWT